MFRQPKGRNIPHKPKSKNIVLYCVVVGILMTLALFNGRIKTDGMLHAPDAPFQVYVIDVGQGDAILVEADAHFMLIDAGDISGGAAVAEFLDAHNVREFDYVIASHLHADHIGGIPKAIEGRKVSQICEPEVSDELLPTNASFEAYLDAVERSGAAYGTLKAGDSFTLGGAVIDVLAPGSPSADDLNDTSLVLRVRYETCTCLLTGDMEEAEQSWLLEQGHDLSADFLKVAHHGSADSTSEAFLEAVQPKYAAISCGKDNDYGHPAGSTLERLENSPNAPEIYVTAEVGTVNFQYTHTVKPLRISVQNPKEDN